MLVIVCLNCVYAENIYEVYSINGSAWEKTGTSWRAIGKDDIVSENAVVKINSNTKIEFSDNWHVYTISQAKQGTLKDIIAWVNKQTTIDKFVDNRKSERLHRVGLVTVRDSVTIEKEDVVKNNEIYILFYDSGRTLTAFLRTNKMKEFVTVEITAREAILNLLDECRATGKGLNPIYDDTRLYSMLWVAIEQYLTDDTDIIFEVPQYLYSINMKRIKISDSMQMGDKYKMSSIEPKL